MKQKLTSVALAALFTASSFAQTAPAPAIDMEARKASVVNLEAQISQREARLAEVREDIKTLDGRIEKRIDSVVKTAGGHSGFPGLENQGFPDQTGRDPGPSARHRPLCGQAQGNRRARESRR